MKTSISRNDNKGVANYIMGSNVFVVMNITLEVDTHTHRVNVLCAHTLRDACN